MCFLLSRSFGTEVVLLQNIQFTQKSGCKIILQKKRKKKRRKERRKTVCCQHCYDYNSTCRLSDIYNHLITLKYPSSILPFWSPSVFFCLLFLLQHEWQWIWDTIVCKNARKPIWKRGKKEGRNILFLNDCLRCCRHIVILIFFFKNA